MGWNMCHANKSERAQSRTKPYLNSIKCYNNQIKQKKKVASSRKLTRDQMFSLCN